MESGRNPLASSSSTFATDLFGSDDTSSPSAVFGSIFSPSASQVTISDANGTQHSQTPDNSSQGSGYKSLDFIFDGEKGKVQQQQPPCHLSSSIYYGGQDIYSDPPHSNQSSTSVAYKKDGDEDDPHSASRGNWWQGSLYY